MPESRLHPLVASVSDASPALDLGSSNGVAESSTVNNTIGDPARDVEGGISFRPGLSEGSPEGGNVIKNGGFDDGTSYWQVSTGVTLTYDYGTPAVPAILLLTPGAGETKAITQSLFITTSGIYTLSVKGRHGNTDSIESFADLSVELFEGAENISYWWRVNTVTSTWQAAEWSIGLSKGDYTLRIRRTDYGGWPFDVYVDDVSLRFYGTALDSPGNLIQNGNFLGDDGWWFATTTNPYADYPYRLASYRSDLGYDAPGSAYLPGHVDEHASITQSFAIASSGVYSFSVAATEYNNEYPYDYPDDLSAQVLNDSNELVFSETINIPLWPEYRVNGWSIYLTQGRYTLKFERMDQLSLENYAYIFLDDVSVADPAQYPLAHTLGNSTWSCKCADPVNTSTGNFTYDHQDLLVPSQGIPFGMSRTYNSLETRKSSLGVGWAGTYAMTATETVSGTVYVTNEDGRWDKYVPNGNTYTADAGANASLTKTVDSFILTRPDQTSRASSIRTAMPSPLALSWVGNRQLPIP
ncbi:MAG: DUF6531 domain-containing protein [Candidatus Marsarchaeota archaeon]|nr:DUF6531 domain-containing protein [Candidatus Marsarchaeota archaeon]